MDAANTCPVMHTPPRSPGAKPRKNQDWWPNLLDVGVLQARAARTQPYGDGFSYAEEFKKLDLEALRADLFALMTASQDWWPADYGHYGPLFIRMAWHSAGTYRIGDGRGGAASGAQRFAPLNSWPDNVNLDKARLLLWPLKQKYGRRISWADLMILAGVCALESMGLKSFGFAGGREDAFEPEDDIDWGSETSWLGDERHGADNALEGSLGAVQMGLIYVNPEGPGGTPDPLAAARDIRETFARMAMNDEETVALIAGGHTFGKAHGAADPSTHVGPAPAAAALEAQGLGWLNSHGSGNAGATITSGLEGAWTTNPVRWDNNYFENLFGYDWEMTRSPAGAVQWIPKDPAAAGAVPDSHDPSLRHAPIMFTTDLALKVDPAYAPIAKRFHDDPEAFAEAFSKAWYKLTHRDMGPLARCLGPYVPKEPQLWQDPIPARDHDLIDDADIADLKADILGRGLSIPALVSAAWASAATFRGTDRRGGANGARIRLAPQKDWAVNEPETLSSVLSVLEEVKGAFDARQTGAKKVSLADLIVLAGGAAVEEAARRAGHDVVVPFVAGRMDASEALTDAASFEVLRPSADGFRNYLEGGQTRSAETLLIERARLLTLTAPEMTVLVGGLRVLGATFQGGSAGILTHRPQALTNDFFVNLLDMTTRWSPSGDLYEGRDRRTDALRWTATRVDLVFGSNAQLRALAEVYAADDGAAAFVSDFVAAWFKVMMLDRFDLA